MFSKNLVIKILDCEKIPDFKSIILDVGRWNFDHAGELYSSKALINPGDIIFDIVGFKLESDSEKGLNDMIDDLIDNFDNLKSDYILKDFDSGELIKEVMYD